MRIPNDNKVTRHVGAGRPNKYPFYELKAGGMITIPLSPEDHHKYAVMRISTCLTNWKKRNGYTWTSAVRSNMNEVLVYRFD